MQASFQTGNIAVTPVSTTVNGTQTLSTSFTLTVVNNTGFASSGYISVVTSLGPMIILQYTGLGINTFTGCTTITVYSPSLIANDGSVVTSTYIVDNMPIINSGDIFGNNAAYLPVTSANWTTIPTTTQGCLDFIAGGGLIKVGTVTSGTWNSGIIGGTYGGSGINNGANTITLGGNLSTGGALAITGTVATGQVLTGTGVGTASWIIPNGYTTTVTAVGTTTLTTSSTYQQYFTGTNTQTVVLPATSTAGNQFSITNLSTGLVTITASGGNVLSILQPGSGIGGSTNILTCIVTNGTTFAAWRGGNVETFTVGTNPLGICFDSTGNIWTANSGSNNVTKLSASTGAVLGTFTVGTTPFRICFDGTNIWTANSGTTTVTKLLASTGALVGTFTVGTAPQGICFDGTFIWTANATSGNVTKLLAATGATIGTYTAGTTPCEVCFDGFNIWVANNGSANVTKLLADTGATIGTYSVGTNPRGLCFDGANIWVANNGSANVTKLLASTGAVIGTYSVGTSPYSVCFDSSGNIWVSDSASTSITKLLAATGSVVGLYLEGVNQRGIYFDGTNIWTGNSSGTTLYKFTQPDIVPANNIQSGPIGVPLVSTFTNLELDINANTIVNNLTQSFSTNVTNGSTLGSATYTILSVMSCYKQFFTGSSTHAAMLPVVTTLPIGFELRLVNMSSGAVTVQTNPNAVVITAATSGVNPTIYTANNTFVAGQIVTIAKVAPVAYNLINATISAATTTTFSIASTVTGPYTSGGVAVVKVSTLPAIGSNNGWALFTCVDNTGVSGIAGWSSEGGLIVSL